jgi:protein-S-isoprenylcysteine O-methyltransferase Ste14
MVRRVTAWVHGVVTGDAKRRALLAPFGPLLLGVLAGCLIAAALWLDGRLGLPPLLRAPWSYAAAAPLAVLGAFLTASPIAAFFKSGGTPSPLDPPPALLDTGLYAHLRNPMLLGEILIGFALGLVLESFTLTLIATPLFALPFVVGIKLVEEPELEQRLGEPYREYRRRVPMFIPRPAALTRRSSRRASAG